MSWLHSGLFPPLALILSPTEASARGSGGDCNNFVLAMEALVSSPMGTEHLSPHSSSLGLDLLEQGSICHPYCYLSQADGLAVERRRFKDEHVRCGDYSMVKVQERFHNFLLLEHLVGFPIFCS